MERSISSNVHNSISPVDPEDPAPKQVEWGPSPSAKILMRAWRALCVLLVTGMTIGIWAAATAHNQPKLYRYSYVDADGVQLDTFGCDVRMIPADAPTIDVNFVSGLFISRVTPATHEGDSSVLRQALIHNLDGCTIIPYDDCSRRCLITVGVPPGAAGASFDIFQDALDTNSYPLLIVETGTRLGRLRVGDWFARAPSMSVFVQPAAYVGSLSTTLVAGNLRTEGAFTGYISASARGGPGSIYVLDVPATGWSAGFRYRQPNDYVCAASNMRTTSFLGEPPWDSCDVDESLRPGGPFSFDYNRAVAHFDSDRNGFVTQTEAAAAMSELRCCGSRCPYNSNCLPLTTQLFPPVDSAFFDRFTLTTSNFFSNVIASNQTWMVGSPGGGGCFDRVNALTPGVPLASAIDIGALYSDRGEILVTLAQDGNNYDGAIGGSLSNSSDEVFAAAVELHDGSAPQIFERSDKPEGWRMAQPDAQRLMSSYGALYGDGDSGGEGFFTFDVEGTPGTPPLRFVYTTNRAYLAMMPSDLRLVSVGLMEPRIFQESVHMLNGGCNVWSARHPLPGPDEIFSQLDTVGFNTTALSPRAAAAQEYARAAFEELSYALRSGGRFDTRELRGNLVLLGDEIDAWGLPTMYVFQRSFGDEFLLRKWQHASERDALITAAILAAIFGLVCGLGATYLVLRVFHFIAREIYRTKRRQALLQAQRAGMPKHMMPKLLEAIGETLRPPHQTPSLVLYSFFTLIDDLLVRPLRQRLNGRSSIRDFCSVRVQISRPGGVYGRVPSFGTSAATPSSVRAMALEQGSDDLPSRTAIKEAYNKPLATLDEFMAQYSLYCLENDVEPLLLDEVMKEIKSPRIGLAVHQYTSRQIHGLKWKSEMEIAATIKDDSQATTSREAELAVKEAETELKMADIETFPTEHILILVSFIRLHCKPGMPNDVIEMEDRPRVGGNAANGRQEIELGFVSRFEKWQRQAHPDTVVVLHGQVWTKMLPPMARYLGGVRVRMVCGGTWREPNLDNIHGGCRKLIGPPGVNGPPSRSWYAFTLWATILHYLIILTPMVLLIGLAMRVQDLWARTMAPPMVGNRRPQILQNVFQPSLGAALVELTSSDVYMLPIVNALLIESVVFLFLSIARALLHYLEFSEPRRSNRPIAWAFLHYTRLCYAVLAALHVAFYFSLGSMAACWFILGAALDPIRFLAYGTAVITLFATMYYLSTSLVNLANRVGMALTLRIQNQLATRLRQARLRIARSKLTQQLVKSRQGNDSSAAEALLAEIQQLGYEERDVARRGARLDDGKGNIDSDEVDANEIFETLDADGNGTLTMAELEVLFEELNMPIAERYKRSMFAQLDVEGDGTVSAEEFQSGWGDMLTMIVEQGLLNAGLSTFQIALAVFTMALLVSLLIAFILVALSGWPRPTLESSVIESILIAAVGAVASTRSKRYQIEKDKGELDRIVHQTLTDSQRSIKPKEA